MPKCVHLGNMDWALDESGHSLTKNRKVLGAAEGTLSTWASDHAIEIHTCFHCLRDGFISQAHKVHTERKAEDSNQQEALEGLVNEMAILSRGRNA